MSNFKGLVVRSALCVALAAIAVPAAAQAPTFGMTPGQVAAALGSDARIVGDREDHRIMGHHRLVTKDVAKDGKVHTANYYFDPKTNRLTMIEMVAPEGECASYENSLRNSGRKPDNDDRLKPAKPGALVVVTNVDWDMPDGSRTSYIEMKVGDDISSCKVLTKARGVGKR